MTAKTVEHLWPYDGPHTPERVADAAEATAALMRYLANATQYGSSVPDGPDLASVLGYLSAVAATMPQVLDQLGRHARRIAEDPTLYDDHDIPGRQSAAPDTARLAAIKCEAAGRAGRELAGVLDVAHGLASRLGHHVEDEEEEP